MEMAMCLHPEPIGEIPGETVRVARAAFPRGTVVIPPPGDQFGAIGFGHQWNSVCGLTVVASR